MISRELWRQQKRSQHFWDCFSLVVMILLILALLFIAFTRKAKAESPTFEEKAIVYVNKYNPTFLPWFGYMHDICKEYKMSEYDMAWLLGRMKYETMLGKRGSGKYYNYAGVMCGSKPCVYQNEFAGIEAIVSLYNRKYKGLTLRQSLRKWVGPWYSERDYNDMQRSITLLTQ